MADVSGLTLMLLAALGLIGGVGITAIGPGGVLPTVGLFALTGLTAAQVAGTSIVTHVATGLFGTAVYARSGQLRDAQTRRLAVLLGGAALLGTPLGIAANGTLSKHLFGILLGLLLILVAILVLVRDRMAFGVARSHPSARIAVGAGLAVAFVSGIVGVGGPMLAVPILIIAGVPVLESLAAAQAQSVVIAGCGTVGYLASGSIDWPLALIIGIPEVIGVYAGWRVAHAIPAHRLKLALVVVLLLLAPYVMLR